MRILNRIRVDRPLVTMIHKCIVHISHFIKHSSMHMYVHVSHIHIRTLELCDNNDKSIIVIKNYHKNDNDCVYYREMLLFILVHLMCYS